MSTTFDGIPATMSGLSLATILNLLSAARIDLRVDDDLSADADNYNHAGLSDSVVLKFTSLNGADRAVKGIETGTLKRVLVVWNGDQVQNLTLPDSDADADPENRIDNGGIDIVLGPNQAAALEYNTNTSRWNCAAVAYPYPSQLAKFYVAVSPSGELASSEKLLRFTFAEFVTFPEDMGDFSFATSLVAADSDASFSLKKNGVEFGTVDFAMNATEGTFDTPETSFEPGDYLEIIGPQPKDADLADVSITLVGNKPFN